YFGETQDGTSVRAIPGEGTHVPVWVLGSSLYGAQLAAYLGLPYAFASHFAPDMLEEALAIYRSSFKPSETLSEPYAMMAAGVCAAETDEEAVYLRSSQILAFARLRTGRPGKLPQPRDDLSAEIPAPVMAQVNHALSCSATGSPATIRDRLQGLIEKHRPDELMVTGMIHDPAARIRSFEIASEVLADLRDVSKVA
ncbi:MAG: MsnO8 family LLM class oxidoreductase, partial [Roseibium sp.]